jgi:hypothetical protein
MVPDLTTRRNLVRAPWAIAARLSGRLLCRFEATGAREETTRKTLRDMPNGPERWKLEALLADIGAVRARIGGAQLGAQALALGLRSNFGGDSPFWSTVVR